MEMVKQDNRRELSARVFLEYILSRTTSVILHGVTFRFTEISTVVSVSSRPVLYLMIHSSDLMENEGEKMLLFLIIEYMWVNLSLSLGAMFSSCLFRCNIDVIHIEFYLHYQNIVFDSVICQFTMITALDFPKDFGVQKYKEII